MAKEQHFHYGGQAIIEGVMIRGRKHMVTAIRKPDKTIQVDKHPLPSLYTGRMRQTPLIRGAIVLIEAMVLGIQMLMHSANLALEEEADGEAKPKVKKEKVTTAWIWLMVIISLGFAVALFFLVPFFLTDRLQLDSAVLFNVVEGIVRIVIFVAYLAVVSMMPDIKRVFAYHGAEHKAVNGFEAGAILAPAEIKKYSRAHIRCGGSFLFVVLIIAIVVFTIVGKQELWLMVGSRVLLLPVIAALGYEVIYFGARHTGNILVKIVLAPGLWLQSLTTREPADDQLEVAIAALETAVQADTEPAVPLATLAE